MHYINQSIASFRASEEEQSAGRAQFLMNQALDADEAGKADEACELYMQASFRFSFYVLLVQCTSYQIQVSYSIMK